MYGAKRSRLTRGAITGHGSVVMGGCCIRPLVITVNGNKCGTDCVKSSVLTNQQKLIGYGRVNNNIGTRPHAASF